MGHPLTLLHASTHHLFFRSAHSTTHVSEGDASLIIEPDDVLSARHWGNEAHDRVMRGDLLTAAEFVLATAEATKAQVRRCRCRTWWLVSYDVLVRAQLFVLSGAGSSVFLDQLKSAGFAVASCACFDPMATMRHERPSSRPSPRPSPASAPAHAFGAAAASDSAAETFLSESAAFSFSACGVERFGDGRIQVCRPVPLCVAS